jgi:hypothetical protein
MPLSLIWLGALLVIAGVVYAATQAIAQGRLSKARQARSAGPTLEPERPDAAGGFGLAAVWPALVLIAAGAAILILAAAV